jgi:MATE family multidrug resistance protein
MSLPALFVAPGRRQLSHVWQLAWPLIVSNLSIPLLGLVDTAIMGHLPHAKYLGAVSVGAAIIVFVYWAFGFLRMGTVGLTAQAYGAHDQQRQWQMLYLPGLLGAVIGLAIIALSPLYIQPAVAYMQATAEVSLLATEYLQIRIYSAPAVLMTYVTMGWLLGRQDSKGPLYILVVTNVSNIIFNLILVLGYDMNSAGVAWGSLIADYIGFAIAAWLVWRQLANISSRQFSFSQSQDIIKQLLSLNGYLFVRTLLLLFTFAFVTAQSANISTEVLAANTILLQYVTLLAYFLDGFAHAAEASTGEAIGQEDESNFYQVVNAAAVYSFIIAVVASAGFYFLQELYLRALTDLPEVILKAQEYVVWVVWLPIIKVWSYLADGIFVGAAKSKAMLHTVWTGLVVMLVIWYTGPADGHSLWLAFAAFALVRSCVAIGCYLYIRQQRSWW